MSSMLCYNYFLLLQQKNNRVGVPYNSTSRVGVWGYFSSIHSHFVFLELIAEHLFLQIMLSQGSRNKTKAVAMADLVTSMKQELDYYWSLGETTNKGMNYSPICKVQQHIREVDRFSYEPFFLSIGPYHHGGAQFRDTDKLKWGCLDQILKLNCEKSLLDYLVVISELAQEARNCYSEEIGMTDEEFLQMLLLDGCFILVGLGGTGRILEHLQQEQVDRFARDESVGENDNEIREQLSHCSSDVMQSAGSNTTCEGDQTDRNEVNEDQTGLWFSRFINHDLFLLENQIPFFVVRKLYELASGNVTLDPPFTDELNKYVEGALRFYPKAIQGPNRPEDFHHLLHLCQIYLRPSPKVDDIDHYHIKPQYIHNIFSFGWRYFKIGYQSDVNEQIHPVGQNVGSQQAGQELQRWRRAAQYIEAGVKFKKREHDILDPHSLLDIKFSKGSIEIPCLVVDEYTDSLFRNVIAFEQTCPQFGDDFTAYIVFMSQIISMPEDVTLLVKREIIVHHLDSDDHVSDLFTMLSKDVVFDFNGKYYLRSMCQAMEEHYQNRLNRWMAWLWLNHFSNPWLALAALATCVVLICTVVQTIFTILAYTNQT